MSDKRWSNGVLGDRRDQNRTDGRTERKVGDSLTITTSDGVVVEMKLVRIVNNHRVERGIDAPRDYKISRVEGAAR